MIAVIGKSLLYFLTACALVGVGSQIIKGPPDRPIIQEVRREQPHCDYLQYMESRDSTKWEVWCLKPAHPWDTVVLVRPDP